MRTSLLRSAVLILLLVGPANAFARTPMQVTEALKALDKFLGADSNAKSWRDHLRTADLKKQLALGDKADVKTVVAILKIYSAKTPGTQLPEFTRVAKSLAAWERVLSAPKPSSLPTMAIALKKSFKVYTPADVAKRKKSLQESLKKLEAFLSESGAENAKSWLEFLQLDRVKVELAKKSPSRSAMSRAIYKLYRNQDGLEMKEFTNVRSALQSYYNVVYFTSLKTPKATFESQVDRLTASLKSYVAKPNTTDAATINSTLGWLQRGQYGGEIVKVLRTHYWQPNLYGQISAAVIKAGVEQEIKDKDQVNELILGTDIRGSVSTKGRITVNLVPDPNQASMNILFKGKANSTNVGYNGPVTINTTGLTTISATKRIYIRSTGFHSDKAVAKCQTSTTVNGISASSGLVERIAWRRVDESQEDAENIASRRAEIRVQQRVDKRALELVGDVNSAYKQKVYLPLVRHEALPKISLSTTKSGIHLNLLQARQTQTAAASAPPAAPKGVDVGLRVHESMVANFSESVIGGWTLTDRLLADIFKDLTGEVPKELQVDLDKDPWSITFDNTHPVSVEFGDKQVTIAVRCRRFVSGGKVVRNPRGAIQVKSTYTIERTKLGANLNRQGDVQVNFLGRKRLTAAQVASKAVLRRKFKKFMKTKIEFTGLKLPGRWKDLGKLRLQTLAANSGWLTLGWNLSESVKNPNVRTARRIKK